MYLFIYLFIYKVYSNVQLFRELFAQILRRNSFTSWRRLEHAIRAEWGQWMLLLYFNLVVQLQFYYLFSVTCVY